MLIMSLNLSPGTEDLIRLLPRSSPPPPSAPSSSLLPTPLPPCPPHPSASLFSPLSLPVLSTPPSSSCASLSSSYSSTMLKLVLLLWLVTRTLTSGPVFYDYFQSGDMGTEVRGDLSVCVCVCVCACARMCAFNLGNVLVPIPNENGFFSEPYV